MCMLVMNIRKMRMFVNHHSMRVLMYMRGLRIDMVMMVIVVFISAVMYMFMFVMKFLMKMFVFMVFTKMHPDPGGHKN